MRLHTTKCLPARGHFSSEIEGAGHCGRGRTAGGEAVEGRPYTAGLKFGDLALEYAPGDTKKSASQMLRRWILRCGPLYEALRAAGWRKGLRRLTPRQEALIRQFIGEP